MVEKLTISRKFTKNYKISSEVKNISEMKKVFVKKYNYKKSKNKIKRIHDLGSRIFRENIKEIQNYL